MNRTARVASASLVAFALSPGRAEATGLLPSAEGWTVTVGGTIAAVPAWIGSNRLGLAIAPRFGLLAPGRSERFSAFDDGISPGIVDLGWLRLGPNVVLVNTRRAGSDIRLVGLRDVGFTVEAGAFAELYPVEWLRLRAAIRHGIGGHGALVGDFGADAIARPDDRWTLSAGPRLFLGADRYADRYFSVTGAESIASGLPVFAARGGVMSYGAVAQITYRFDGGWRLTGFAGYERLTGDAARAPLVAQRGSVNQVTVGTSLTYSFTIGR